MTSIRKFFAPAAAAALHDQALAVGMLLQERQREAVQPGEVLAQVPLADPRFVLAKRHIEAPMTAILDAPVAPHRAGELLHVHRQTADVVADLDGLLPLTQAADVTTPIDFSPFHSPKPGRPSGAGSWR